jgi:hypothetical protein
VIVCASFAGGAAATYPTFEARRHSLPLVETHLLQEMGQGLHGFALLLPVAAGKMFSFDPRSDSHLLASGVLDRFMMPAIFVNPEWWNWMMFIIVPILFVILVVAVWAIVSGLMGLLRQPDSTPVDRRAVPDIMGFLKGRYIRTNRRFPYESIRRHLIRR